MSLSTYEIDVKAATGVAGKVFVGPGTVPLIAQRILLIESTPEKAGPSLRSG
jgi:hypothetical protein